MKGRLPYRLQGDGEYKRVSRAHGSDCMSWTVEECRRRYCLNLQADQMVFRIMALQHHQRSKGTEG